MGNRCGLEHIHYPQFLLPGLASLFSTLHGTGSCTIVSLCPGGLSPPPLWIRSENVNVPRSSIPRRNGDLCRRSVTFHIKGRRDGAAVRGTEVRVCGSSYYDNVRPLAYPDSDAVLICFDISRPETLDSVLKKWQGETQEFCPNAKIVLVGCKLDMRTDLNTLRELSKQRLIPVTHEQGTCLARQIGAVAYAECTSKFSENSVRDVFHVTTVASVARVPRPHLKRSNSRRGLKRVSQQPPRTDIMEPPPAMRKDRAKSCALM
ncbi:rho-related GTP-binding protein RhoN-like isoform X1 [Denticeps clupeoides]|uniref:rho-related GTP-binding protein RhoN-like isoform X1 n=1 Tax=Denticeps clupeoides TaxID=299321 RepID=UPI0010A38941|nr:rho-related GTP-binding protein RhoN-like isoform X1 [Denticeps clupeoides]XP_028825566.1 rho-related GTP-binding protein RhoN-like isoform X1 [Denticeps clupeoides]